MSSPIHKITPLVLAVLIWFSPNVFASVIILATGKTIETEITYRDDEMIKVDSGYGVDITYYFDEIKFIDGQPPTSMEEFVEADTLMEEPQSIEVNDFVPEIKDVEIDDDVEVLESIVIIKDVEEVDPVKEEKPIAEVEPVKGGGFISRQVQIKEFASPFGPTISDNNEPIENISPVVLKIDEPLPEVQTTKDQDNTFQRFIENQKNNFYKHKIDFQGKLEEIPVKVRRDMLAVFSLVFIFLYTIICFPLMLIAKKLERKSFWLTWIPIIHIFYLVHVARKSFWLNILFLIPFLNIALLVILFASIAKELEKPRGLAILILFPVINIFMLWYLALSGIDQNYKRIKYEEI